MEQIVLNQAKQNALRSAYNVDIEITAVFSIVENKEKKIGYRYTISKWNKDDTLERNIYSPNGHIYLTYSDALAIALTRVRDELDLPPVPEEIKNLKN